VDASWDLHVDPDVLRAWSPAQLGSVLVHHAAHALRDHAGRGRSLGVDDDMDLWVLAADLEINDDLGGAELQTPFPLMVPPDVGLPTGRLAEEYFRDLRGRPRATAACGFVSVGNGDKFRAVEQELIRCHAARACVNQSSGERGQVPRRWRRWAQQTVGGTVDWRAMLAAEIRRALSYTRGLADYSFQHPSRRYGAASDAVLPSLVRPLLDIAVVCDTSGSMTDEMLGRAVSELRDLVRSLGLGSHGIRLLVTDAAVHGVLNLTGSAPVELVGGGGTDMTVGIVAAARLRPTPAAIIVLSDGFTSWPLVSPTRIPVILGRIEGPLAALDARWPAPPWMRQVGIPAA